MSQTDQSDLMPAVSPLKLLLTVLYLLVWPALILFLSGDWHWRQGWMFGGWFLFVCVSAIGWLYRNNRALLAERYRQSGSGGQSRRDRIVVYLLVVGFIAWIVLQPLDAHRFRWTPRLPLAVEVAGGALLTLSWLFLFRSFTDNAFLSPLVRIQSERKHRVVSGGVYGVVRHPMYLGAILMFLGAPLLMGAISALLVGVLPVAPPRHAHRRRGEAARDRARRLRRISTPRALPSAAARLVDRSLRSIHAGGHQDNRSTGKRRSRSVRRTGECAKVNKPSPDVVLRILSCETGTRPVRPRTFRRRPPFSDLPTSGSRGSKICCSKCATSRTSC